MSPVLALSLAVVAADAPADFIAEVAPLYRLVTCHADVPKHLDAAAVEKYCKTQRPRFERFRDRWTPKARAFFEPLKPAGLPTDLVYPFGGGDLMTALAVFPEATVVSTLSLELAGDPRRLTGLGDAKVLAKSLSAIANASASTLMSNDSLSKNLSATQQGELPGQLSMHLMGLALFGFEPVSVRYFRLEPDGALHYLSLAEVKALDGTKADQLNAKWKPPDFSPAFANVEVQYVPVGQPQAPRRVHRHFAANLSDPALPEGLLPHLEAKGRVAAMTKAASYLLWHDGFSKVRGYLVAHADFMPSDSTGVPPRFWTKAGCSVRAYGRYAKSFLGNNEARDEELKKVFARAAPKVMRFGYPDGSAEKTNHVLVASCPSRQLQATPPRAP